MKFLVTCKRVTDPEMKIKVLNDGTGVDLDDANYAINPFDEIAIEAAVQKVEEDGEGEVVLVAIGDDEYDEQIRHGLAMGANRAIRVVVEDGENLDSDSIAKILAAIYKEEEPDLFILGKQSIDGDSSQIPQLIAEYLDLPQATFVSKIEYQNDAIKVIREVDGGLETLELPTPALISVDLRLNEPRYPSIPNMMKAKKKELKEVELDELDISLPEKQKVVFKKLIAPPQRKGGIKVSSVEELYDKLKNEANVL
ncbi:electron transfer flavoprotein subunit beta/FixA family protein [bacterium]|nr:electron transfer flavoprotein subunit beta/FixA family protein [bacterium]